LWPPQPALKICFHISSVVHCSSLRKVQYIHAFNYLTIHQVVEVYFHSSLTLTLDRGEWSASGVDCFIPVTTEEAVFWPQNRCGRLGEVNHDFCVVQSATLSSCQTSYLNCVYSRIYCKISFIYIMKVLLVINA